MADHSLSTSPNPVKMVVEEEAEEVGTEEVAVGATDLAVAAEVVDVAVTVVDMVGVTEAVVVAETVTEFTYCTNEMNSSARWF
jgi:hypothetical protein